MDERVIDAGLLIILVGLFTDFLSLVIGLCVRAASASVIYLDNLAFPKALFGNPYIVFGFKTLKALPVSFEIDF